MSRLHHNVDVVTVVSGVSAPFQAFRTKDGDIVVAATNNRQFVTVCQVNVHNVNVTSTPL